MPEPKGLPQSHCWLGTNQSHGRLIWAQQLASACLETSFFLLPNEGRTAPKCYRTNQSVVIFNLPFCAQAYRPQPPRPCLRAIIEMSKLQSADLGSPAILAHILRKSSYPCNLAVNAHPPTGPKLPLSSNLQLVATKGCTENKEE